jgi:hypothetical protein
MKILLILIFSFLAIGLLFSVKNLTYSECDTPMAFKIGSVDSHFGSDIPGDLQVASGIWSVAYGKSLFIDTPKATLTVNFVYDQRSALNTRIDQTQNQLNQKSSTLEAQINSYNTDAAVLKQKISDFNTRVDQINKSGGASPDVYKNLISEQRGLNAQGDALNARAKNLNLASQNYNTEVQDLNQNISQYNQALAQKPEEGLYDGNAGTITIYFINDRDELVHTITHEFGHALGMQHTIDPKSIMYPYTSSGLAVTPEDRAQLDFVCRQQSLPRHWLQNLHEFFIRK